MVLGVTGTALLYFVGTGDYLIASLFFIFGNVGFAGSLVFYDSLLPHVARPNEIDMVSSRGFAMGYIGGGLLLAGNLAMIMLAPEDLTGLMSRLSFLSVAIWWFIFTLPLLRNVPEPPRRIAPGEDKKPALGATFSRLGKTFKEIRRFRDLFLMLIAFLIYGNGIGTIITMATIYGAEIGIGQTALIGTLLMVQFLAAPFAIFFGWLAKRIGAKRSIYICLSVYTVISILGYFMSVEWHFWVLGALVATVQGGSQALSRSIIGRLMPKSKSAEFFGFFSVSEKFSSIAGPAIFGLVAQIMGHSRLSIVSLIFFFVIGFIFLRLVNIERGVKEAEAEEARMVSI
jgi:UMF1 family MFS transporter